MSQNYYFQGDDAQLVLILVVMEYTQWVMTKLKKVNESVSLNPCCNGIYSMSPLVRPLKSVGVS